MGLDIYAGTLTQYYSDNWVSSIQKFAEESGMTYKKVTPDSDLNPSIFHKFYQWITKSSKNKQVNEATKLWRDNLIKALSKTDNKVTTWEETDKKEYFTERLDWTSYGTLALLIACRKFKKPFPETLSKDWVWYDDPIVTDIIEFMEKDEFCSSIISIDLWIPSDQPFIFSYPTIAGNKTTMSTTGALLNELNLLNQTYWQANESTIINWMQTEEHPADIEFTDGKTIEHETPSIYHTESLAKYAFSIFYQMALFSQKTKVPIVMDY